MTRETCELFTREVMPTGRIPLRNGSGRVEIQPTKQSAIKRQEEHGTAECSHVDYMSIQASKKLVQAGMVEWNRNFRLPFYHLLLSFEFYILKDYKARL